ncbi:MAG: ABC transporter permease [Acidimicrobiales bacterium]
MLAHELRRRCRDRSVVVTALVAPLVLSGILGFAFAGGGAVPGVRIGIALVTTAGTAQGGPGADGVGRALEQRVVAAGVDAAALPGWVRTVTVTSPGALRRDVADGTLDGGVIVPSQLGLVPSSTGGRSSTPAGTHPGSGRSGSGRPGSGRSGSGRSGSGRVSTSPAALARLLTPVVAPGTGNVGDGGLTVVGSRSSLTGTEAASAVASGIASRLFAGVLVARTMGIHSVRGIHSIAVAAAQPPNLAVGVTTIGNAGRNVLDFFAPSIAVIFLFITAGLGTRALLIERTEGTLVRIAAAPVRPSSIVAGKLGAIGVTSLASMAAVWGVTTLAFHADWGDPPAVLLMCVGSTVAIGGVSVFLTSLAKDERQAFGIAMVAGLAFALFGGNLLPPGALPGILEDLSLGTPNGWALVGFGRLALEGGGIAAVVGPFAVLAAIGAVFGAAAATRVQRMVEL